MSKDSNKPPWEGAKLDAERIDTFHQALIDLCNEYSFAIEEFEVTEDRYSLRAPRLDIRLSQFPKKSTGI